VRRAENNATFHVRTVKNRAAESLARGKILFGTRHSLLAQILFLSDLRLYRVAQNNVYTL
jgi:hypothetical protein